jgi:predicted signal transduction protein with EAL and GGDEF domain
MADLRVEDATLAQAQSTFRTAGNRLAPVVGAVKGLNSEVVGAEPLSEELHNAHSILAVELGITGQALTELAAHANEIKAAFDHADQALTREARADR